MPARHNGMSKGNLNIMTFQEITQKLKTGTSQEIQEAKKELEKFWRTHYHSPKRSEIEKFLLENIKNFAEIKKMPNKLAMLSALKLPIFSFGIKHYEVCRDFILKFLENENGHLRFQAIFAGEYLYMSMMPLLSSNDKSNQEFIKENKKRESLFVDFVITLFKLADKYSYQLGKKKYINRLSPCIYKSVQMLLNRLLASPKNREILYQHGIKVTELQPGKNSLAGDAASLTSEQERKVKEIEKSLEKFLKRYGIAGKLSVKQIKKWIWDDEGESVIDASNRFQKKIFSYLPAIEDVGELNDILQVLATTWNHFPHRSLGGKSPQEIVNEELLKNPEVFLSNLLLWAKFQGTQVEKILEHLALGYINKEQTSESQKLLEKFIKILEDFENPPLYPVLPIEFALLLKLLGKEKILIKWYVLNNLYYYIGAPDDTYLGSDFAEIVFLLCFPSCDKSIANFVIKIALLLLLKENVDAIIIRNGKAFKLSYNYDLISRIGLRAVLSKNYNEVTLLIDVILFNIDNFKGSP